MQGRPDCSKSKISSSDIRYDLPIFIAESFLRRIQSHTVMVLTPYLAAISSQVYNLPNGCTPFSCQLLTLAFTSVLLYTQNANPK